MEETDPQAKKEVAVPEAPAAISSAQAQEEKDSLETEQVVVFQLENEEYAAPILEVQEIIPAGDITPFPNVPDYIAGIINIRGTVATVINLAKRFSLTRKDTENVDRYIILTNTGKALFGIMVDEVTSVMKIPRNAISQSSTATSSNISNEYVSGVAVVDELVILILDFQKILEDEEIKAISAPHSNPGA